MQISPENFTRFFAPFAGGTLFCGFSGGADSTAALLVTAAAARHLSFTVTAVHINHHLRGAESDREAEEAGTFCRERGMAFRKIDLTYEPGEKQDENTLREKRLAVWKKLVSRSAPPAAVVLGHHADDAAENLLLKWGRGGNVSGLTAPAANSMLGNVTLLRPLLPYSRAEIEDFLRREGVTRWAVDSSNLESSHTLRNRLRLNILPQLYKLHPGFREGVRQSLNALRSDAECLDALAAQQLASWQNCRPDGIPVSELLKLPEALRFRAVKLLADTAELSRAAMTELEEFLQTSPSPETRRFHLPSSSKIFFLRDGKLRAAAVAASPPSPAWRWRETPQCQAGEWLFRVVPAAAEVRGPDFDTVSFDADRLPDTLRIESLKAGEKMIPFGRTGAVSVKKLRTDRHLAAIEAPPALRLTDGTILWAPHIRRSALFPVTEQTENIVRFELQNTNSKEPCMRYFALDIGNVTIQLHPERAFAALAQLGIKTLPPELLYLESQLLERGLVDDACFASEFRRLTHTAVTDAEFFAIFDAMIGNDIPGMVDLLKELIAKEIQPVFFSDTSARHLAQVRRMFSAEQLVPEGIYSFAVRAKKPEKAMFTAFESRFGRPVFYVDDRPELINAAGQHGWHAIAFTGAARLRAALTADGIL